MNKLFEAIYSGEEYGESEYAGASWTMQKVLVAQDGVKEAIYALEEAFSNHGTKAEQRLFSLVQTDLNSAMEKIRELKEAVKNEF